MALGLGFGVRFGIASGVGSGVDVGVAIDGETSACSPGVGVDIVSSIRGAESHAE